MGLQRFKLQIANTVISQENSNLQTMGTEQLLDLFQYEQRSQQQQKTMPADDENTSTAKEEDESTKSSFKSLLEELPEWDDQYETEYDLTEFIRSLKN